jgi:hypothetical protein
MDEYIRDRVDVENVVEPFGDVLLDWQSCGRHTRPLSGVQRRSLTTQRFLIRGPPKSTEESRVTHLLSRLVDDAPDDVHLVGLQR